MTLESQPEVVAETPAPESVATAAPETPVEQTPETPKEAKTFTQEELDAAIGKRLAREQRKWEREQAQKVSQPQAPVNIPPVSEFESPEAYAEALAVKKAQELIAQRDAQAAKAQALEGYHEREEKARDRYDDFEQVAYNPNLRITDVMAETIQYSDVGPDLAYYLGTNPKEADRISRLSPFLQAKEIGKLEAKLADNPPVKKTSNAPAPISPVNARGTTQNGKFDTTDPRSIETMSTSDWIAAERQRQIKKREAMNR